MSAVRENNPIGLDLGMRHINMVELSSSSAGLGLRNFASVSLGPDRDKGGRLSQLKELVQEKKIAGLPVNIAVSGESVVVRYIDLPKMNKQEIGQALKYEAEQYIPFKIEEVVFDYHILVPAGPARNKMKVLLVAAKREAIMELVEFIREAGLKPNLIDVTSFALINCFQVNGPKMKQDDVFALVNLEFDLVNINILRGEVPLFSRDISLSEGTLSISEERSEQGSFFATIKPFLANLIRELRLSIDYFESEFEKQVYAIYLSGEGTNTSELSSFFSSQLGREVNLWSPMQNLGVDSTHIDIGLLTKASPILALACGLALRGTI